MLQRTERTRVGGPYFEDLAVGQVFDDAPALTLTSGHAALHQALVGDRLRLALDAELSRLVTGCERLLAHPNLVCDIAIGQSTGPTQRVLGNLFYRGLVLLSPVFIGDTLRTKTEVVALKQNRPRPGRPATGLVALRITTENQHGEGVLDFWRCPMLPLREPDGETGHADDFDAIPAELDSDRVRAAVPAHWRLGELRERVRGHHFDDLVEGSEWEIEGRDTVTSAPELVRLTLNLASAHSDAGATPHGRRLVYGGHTISVAAAHATRALPNLATIVAWHGCDHLRPVHEGDALRTELSLDAKHSLDEGGLVDLRACVWAERDDAEAGGRVELPVLDWRFVGVMA
ncbi:MAG TPA: MaoC family dehydratase [Solirubrobacteraceae bacterium]|nr:MaoC family dehydratase [Solirubrobacteraceae bacterium]